ncbi:hypothetical protein SEPCBS119000_000357 [Sporothrix epigloea]|uniref:C2H2-type domain-containing protein n=1 Tax=Sporothrix epigloea TaxID=1892477 RepID=A0ABP0D5P6_9PEZI
MAKRQSPRRSSLSSGSPMAEYETDGALDVASKPPKRLKTVRRSAASGSPDSTIADAELEDTEMNEANDDADHPLLNKAKKAIRSERRNLSRSGETEDTGGLKNNDGNGRSMEREVDEYTGANAVDEADVEATVIISDTHNQYGSRRNGNSNGTKASASAAPRHGDGGGDEYLETMSTISEDTDGEIPPPKKTTRSGNDDDPTTVLNTANEPQVTICAWDGCEAGDQGTMDRLVEHLHAEHVEGKQRRYTCEWIGCPRKGKSHASAYALKAHLRSHTREKPHICLLPECDLAFARQDALNKHMRTSHEIDMMRYFEAGQRRVPVGALVDPSGSGANGIAINGNGASLAQGSAMTNGKNGGSSKLKIIIKTPQSHAAGHEDSVDGGACNGTGSGGSGGSEDTSLYHFTSPGSETTTLAKDQGFTAHELELSPKELYGVCRLQLQWAEKESEELHNECIVWEGAAHKAWLEQQVLLEQVVLSEKDWYERRKAVLASLAIEEEKRAAEKRAREAERDAAAEEEDGDGDNDDDDVKDEDDSGVDDGDDVDDVDGDEDDDDDVPSVMLDPDATQDDYSFADTTTFSVMRGSSLRNELAVNGN